MKLPVRPPSSKDLFEAYSAKEVMPYLLKGIGGRKEPYYHWDKLRRKPTPDGIAHELWWLVTKMRRSQSLRAVPLLDSEGITFSYTWPDALIEMQHIADSQLRGNVGFSEQVTNSSDRERYVVSSLIEEAITSSQLEGAATTRKEAVAMLRAGREPRDKSERMILNNYHAMRRIQSLASEKLSPELVCELHAIVTDKTLDNPDMAGSIQRPEQKRIAVYDQENNVLHQPPAAEELPERMALMCQFANGELEQQSYMHPIVRAIVLHFWLAYDHPFEDGNGRTARALFYWLMLAEGYWLCEYVSISSLIHKAPVQYAKSFLYTETDDNDLTYFILHQLRVLLDGVKALELYLKRKTRESKDIERHLRDLSLFNHRQKALLAHALKHPNAEYTIESHTRSHNVTYATGRSDLLKLLDKQLLKMHKVGKKMYFRVPVGIESRLSNL